MLCYSTLRVPRVQLLRFPPLWCTGLALLLTRSAVPAVAQVTVTANRDLAFGFVTRGVPASISPTDAVNSAQWTIGVSAGKLLQLSFTLPTDLTGPGGATLPITFGSSDAFRQETSGGLPGTFFNPNTTTTVLIVLGPGLTVRLGGRVSPAALQASGAYQNTVILTVAVLN